MKVDKQTREQKLKSLAQRLIAEEDRKSKFINIACAVIFELLEGYKIEDYEGNLLNKQTFAECFIDKMVYKFNNENE